MTGPAVEGATVRLRVCTAHAVALFSLPAEGPADAMFPSMDLDMLHGATLYTDEAHIERRRQFFEDGRPVHAVAGVFVPADPALTPAPAARAGRGR